MVMHIPLCCKNDLRLVFLGVKKKKKKTQVFIVISPSHSVGRGAIFPDCRRGDWEASDSVGSTFASTLYPAPEICFINRLSLCTCGCVPSIEVTLIFWVKTVLHISKCNQINTDQLFVLWTYSAFIFSVHFKWHMINITLHRVPKSVWQ